ncbi:TIGR02221 family CRISPR-associated protein [Caenibacillus caldisaponilyticus]|uniref:TIGR02221 family CRISPR-associated protein n=1 Tax=Caenibacillus caldisaponilyticus TaxID=1674942 RepID=UPI0009884C42|nr:TIGR02221 family CRISPR-associated protein [Caenibacillus caldisaponilyticus]
MSRKILLSFLGLTEYEACYYVWQGKRSSYTRFVQTALYEFLNSTEPLEVLLLVTEQAKRKNWCDSISKDGKPLEGLKSAFKRIAPDASIKLVDIADSLDESSNWLLFDKVMSEIQDGDEIYFDITHSFRSIPFMALIILNYARLVKKAKIGKVMYGWFEKLGRPDEINNKSAEERLAPIVDMTNMVALFDWTNGVDQFIRTGDASLIKELTEREAAAFHRDDSIGKDEKAQVTEWRRLAKSLDKVGKAFQTSRSLQIIGEIRALRDQLQKVQKLEASPIKPFSPLFDEIHRKYERFFNDKSKNFLNMAKWCEENGLIQPGLTLLQENCITALCYVLDIDWSNTDKRRDVASAITILLKDIPREKWRVRDVQFVEKVIEQIKPFRDLLKPFSELTEYRNDINHAGTGKNVFSSQRLYQKLKDNIEKLEPFFRKMDEIIKSKTGERRPEDGTSRH